MSEPGAVAVGIALVRRGGRYLIRRRPPLPGSPMPGVWEFPGGKCEPGEPPENAAARECLEESGIEVRALATRRSIRFRYPHGLIDLHYVDCEPIDPGAEPRDGSGFLWVDARELPDRAFPDANGPILRELADESSIPGTPGLE